MNTNFTLLYNYKTKRAVITTYDDTRDIEIPIFIGIIKTLPELKKIMKQTLINL